MKKKMNAAAKPRTPVADPLAVDLSNAAMKKVVQARANLVLFEPFFGSLALRLKLVVDPCVRHKWPCPDSCRKTMWTDGTHLGFNPGWIMSLTLAEIEGTVCHEVLHNGCGHPWRREGRSKEGWNISCDFAIDPIILEAKHKLPGGGYVDPAYVGKSAEWIYGSRQQQQQDSQPKSGQDQGSTGAGAGGDSGEGGQEDEQEGQSRGDSEGEGEGKQGEEGGGETEDADEDYGCGEVRDAVGEDVGAQEAEWQVATFQAAQAALGQGKLPAGLQRLVEEMRKPVVDWKAALRRFFQVSAKNDFTWKQPNRRYIAAGLYLPALRSEAMRDVVILWDTSGSRDDEKARAECAAEITEIIEECKPERTHVIYCDAAVQRVDVFERGDPVKFNPVGGGGTDFRPSFLYVEQEGIDLACFIGITDLMGDFPKTEPGYPVLWAATTDIKAPFGETIKITD